MNDVSDASARLRSNIRTLGDLLGHTLVRQEGQSLLDLVEQVRKLSREDPSAAASLLSSSSLPEATLLARSFSIYFDLANVAEQVERTNDVLDAYRSAGSPLQRVVLEAKEMGGFTAADVDRVARNLSVRPVFTAHPTEAARRSVLLKLRRIADTLLDATLSDSAAACDFSSLVPNNWLGPKHPDKSRRDATAYEDWSELTPPGSEVWVNPPYTPIPLLRQFLERAARTASKGTSVMVLVPASVGTNWWHELVLGAGAEVEFLKGRLAYTGPHSQGAPRLGPAHW